MGELVAHIDQLVDDRAMRPVQHVAERVVPQPLHDLQQLLGIEAELPVLLWPPLGKARDHVLRPALAKRDLQPLHHERLQALGQQLHAFENGLACTLCHLKTALKYPSPSGGSHLRSGSSRRAASGPSTPRSARCRRSPPSRPAACSSRRRRGSRRGP